jgi:integrase
LIDIIACRGHVMANRTLALVKTMFRWAAGRHLIEVDSSAYVEKPLPEPKRDRVLSDDELVRVWNAAGELGNYGVAVRLLILTGARPAEIFDLCWAEIDLEGEVIYLSAVRNTVNEPRIIPLSPMAVELLRGLAPAAPEAHVFDCGSREIFSGVSYGKARLDRLVGGSVADWRVYDLRRTVATGLQQLGVCLEVTETILGHIARSRAGIAGIYQQHKVIAEAGAALLGWTDHVIKLVGGEPAKVVQLPRSPRYAARTAARQRPRAAPAPSSRATGGR